MLLWQTCYKVKICLSHGGSLAPFDNNVYSRTLASLWEVLDSYIVHHLNPLLAGAGRNSVPPPCACAKYDRADPENQLVRISVSEWKLLRPDQRVFHPWVGRKRHAHGTGTTVPDRFGLTDSASCFPADSIAVVNLQQTALLCELLPKNSGIELKLATVGCNRKFLVGFLGRDIRKRYWVGSGNCRRLSDRWTWATFSYRAAASDTWLQSAEDRAEIKHHSKQQEETAEAKPKARIHLDSCQLRVDKSYPQRALYVFRLIINQHARELAILSSYT